jgi:glutaminyl-peptide cyclotransferase
MKRAAAAGALLAVLAGGASASAPDFDAGRAWAHLEAYMRLSPVTPGSEASASFAAYVRSALEPLGFSVELDEWRSSKAPVPLRNIVARRGAGPAIRIVGAHYDARLWADKDPDPARRRDPVPAANDGGSGVAVLLELARAVQVLEGTELWLAFFDAEDQGGIEGWGDWILGSERMAGRLTQGELGRVSEVIVVDIVGQAGLKLRPEAQSDREVTARIWQIAAELGYADTFLTEPGGAVVDDHVPFLRLGLRAVDVIQLVSPEGESFFPWHHTTLDTLERVSSESLARVGRTLELYLETAPVAVRAPAGLALPGGWLIPAAAAALGAAAAGWRLKRSRDAAPPAPPPRRGRRRPVRKRR